MLVNSLCFVRIGNQPDGIERYRYRNRYRYRKKGYLRETSALLETFLTLLDIYPTISILYFVLGLS